MTVTRETLPKTLQFVFFFHLSSPSKEPQHLNSPEVLPVSMRGDRMSCTSYSRSNSPRGRYHRCFEWLEVKKNTNKEKDRFKSNSACWMAWRIHQGLFPHLPLGLMHLLLLCAAHQELVQPDVTLWFSAGSSSATGWPSGGVFLICYSTTVSKAFFFKAWFRPSNLCFQ